MGNYTEKFEKMRAAGNLAARVLDMLTDHIKPGVSTGRPNVIADFSSPGARGNTLPTSNSSARIAAVARILKPETVTPLSSSATTRKPALSAQLVSACDWPCGVATASVPLAPAGGTTA